MSADHVRAGHAGINLAIGLIPNDTPSIDEMRSYVQSGHVKWVKQPGLEGSQQHRPRSCGADGEPP
jgi:hypothetical protein